MNNGLNEKNNLNDVDFEYQDENSLNTSKEPKRISKYFLIFLALFTIIFIFLYFLPNIICFLYPSSFYNGNENIIDFIMLNSLKLNLTWEEYSQLSAKMAIINDIFSTPQTYAKYFRPLFTIKDIIHLPDSLLPINKISFLISSNPSNSYLCKLYFDVWSTKYGSNIVKKTGIHPLKTVYWRYIDAHPLNLSTQKFTNLFDYDKFKSYKIDLINETSFHRKWFYMLPKYFENAPPEIEWFVMMDDDTLIFLDRVIPMLSKYKDPLNNLYLIHSPGERITTTHIGNGGAGFYLSRKLVETIIPHLKECSNHLNRKHLNGDIRLDKCVRSIADISPTLDYGLFHMDPKGFKGDLTGFVEGYIDKYKFKALHHLEKWKFYLFPKLFLRMMEANDLHNVRTVYRPQKGSAINLSFDSFPKFGNTFFSQAAHFARTATVSGELFLKRYAIMINKDKHLYFCILNFGYSLVIFDIEFSMLNRISLSKEILHYLSGVEQTFEFTPSILYENLSRLIIPANNKLKRLYLKKIVQNDDNTHWQEFCQVSTPKTIAKVFFDGEKVSLDFFDNSYIN